MMGHGFPKPRVAGSSPARRASNLFTREHFKMHPFGHFLNSPFCDHPSHCEQDPWLVIANKVKQSQYRYLDEFFLPVTICMVVPVDQS